MHYLIIIICIIMTMSLWFSEPVKALCHPGPCGHYADCYIVEATEQCYCKPGYTGDPYTACHNEPRNACFPNPCGPHALCTVTPQGQSMCLCPDGMAGDPLNGCGGPQCSTDDDCPWELACMGYKCRDPCPGACGFGATCRVEKHHPVCTCNQGLIGTPTIRCYAPIGEFEYLHLTMAYWWMMLRDFFTNSLRKSYFLANFRRKLS